MAGAAYNDAACPGGGVSRPADDLAAEAFAAMGPRARVMPMIVLHGDQDGTVPPACGEKAVEQWVKTNNLVLGADVVRAAGTREEPKPGGHPATVSSYADAQGCLVIEHWSIHGMDHFWSGGTTDPAYAEVTDPKGPSAGEASWRFFARYRSETGAPCAETQPTVSPAAAAACIFVRRLPRGALHVRVYVDGRRRAARVRGRTVRVRATPGATVRIVARVRGRRVVRSGRCA